MNVIANQALILAGQPARAVTTPDSAAAPTAVSLPSGGTALQRVTVVAGRAGGVLVQADYYREQPETVVATVIDAAVARAPRAPASDLARADDGPSIEKPAGGGPAAHYARAGLGVGPQKGALLDVHA